MTFVRPLRIGRLRVTAAAVLLALGGCATAPALPPVAAIDPASVQTPADLYGDLFVAIQTRRIFPDGKTFVDAVPKRAPAEIMRDWRAAGALDDAGLRAFVLANFDVPGLNPVPVPEAGGKRVAMAEHIRRLWPVLTRPPLVPPAGSSALALPRPYVVPGGRFRELYYWDSYFTMLGLKADGQGALVDSMIDDFVALVERYGHVPNGTRSYYLSRSQPPFLYAMMALSPVSDAGVKARRLAALKREWAYWTTPERTTTMPDGTTLQHYWDARATPRDESYREDVETARASGQPVAEVYRDLRAGAESGWDYSSRWLADGQALASIDTTAIVPVDLNSLLFGLEQAIATGCADAGDTDCASTFTDRAATRRNAVERWLWDEAGGRYGDYDPARKAVRSGVTAATLYPLFTGLASKDHGKRTAEATERLLLAPNGLRTTTVATGQQWDKPNGWAPLQWIAVEGLTRYDRGDLAAAVALRFVGTVEREYRASGKLLEKYDVEQSRAGGGGEYPTQDGFGWTNGVVRALQGRYPGM
jgi:alpha,alpha-trehalase